MKTLTLQIFIFMACFSYGQEYSFLDSRNGFRNIRLGTLVSDYPQFREKDASNMDFFKLSMNLKTSHVCVGAEKDRIGTARILFIYLIAENSLISEIRVVTEKVLDVYSTLENAYGKPTDRQGTKLTWRTDGIECSIEGDNSPIPGYHICYKVLSKARKELNALKALARKKAQAEL
jgi:hypothetical protein